MIEVGPNRFSMKDKASSYHRSLKDRARTLCIKLVNPKIKIGKNTILKKGCQFDLTDNAELKIGENCTIKENCYFLLTMPNPKVYIGNFSGLGRNNYIAIKGTLKIGNYVRIGANVSIYDQGHQFNKDNLIMNQTAIIENVTIGNDIWIGDGVKILKGVTIHDGAVIGAGAVVTKSIPSYEIWAGIPARFIKKRT